jgi:hypothetical protein
MIYKNKPQSRKDGIVVKELDGEDLIFDLRSNKEFCLNETASMIWRACDGDNDIPGITEFLREKLGDSDSEELVWPALSQLKKDNLIENVADVTDHFAGISRRQVIKNIGLASMVAVPIVASMVAPASVYAAASCITVLNGCDCPNGTPTGRDCTTTALIMCASASCRCVDNGMGGTGGGNCVP